MGRIVAHFVLVKGAVHMYLRVWEWAVEERFADHQDQAAICYREPRQ
jgi:hypothetical protein